MNCPYSSIDERLLKLTDRSGACWLWQGHLMRDGYAHIKVNGRFYFVHRFSYEHHVGPIPEGHQIDHLCRVRNCINPEHLEAVTPLVNVQRSPSWNGNKTHCPKGHPYDEANTARMRDGRRLCRTCRRAAGAAYRLAKKETSQ